MKKLITLVVLALILGCSGSIEIKSKPTPSPQYLNPIRPLGVDEPQAEEVIEEPKPPTQIGWQYIFYLNDGGASKYGCTVRSELIAMDGYIYEYNGKYEFTTYGGEAIIIPEYNIVYIKKVKVMSNDPHFVY